MKTLRILVLAAVVAQIGGQVVADETAYCYRLNIRGEAKAVWLARPDGRCALEDETGYCFVPAGNGKDHVLIWPMSAKGTCDLEDQDRGQIYRIKPPTNPAR